MNKSELIQRLSALIRVPPLQLSRMLSNAPYRYRHYRVKKRSGGWRDIYQPTAALKEVQRWIVRECLSKVPVSDAVFSYREARGIRQQAKEHVRSNYFVRIDIVNFFPSINGAVVLNYLKSMRNAGLVDLDDEALWFVVSCMCRRDSILPGVGGLALTIGAPSSPFVSNCILYQFDQEILRFATARGAVYTRYADDIFVSARSVSDVLALEANVRQGLKKHAPFLQVNEPKVRRFSRRSRVRICGVNISSTRDISVGRDTKKLLRAKLDWAIKGRLDEVQLRSLQGWLAYMDSIEPGYVARLLRRVEVDAVPIALRPWIGRNKNS